MAELKEKPGAGRVLTMSTIAFTFMFAVWLMFGILGKPIQEEFGLSDVELSWISAVAVLNGSMWRLPAGILADKVGGRKVMLGMLLLGAVASLAVSWAQNYAMLLILAFLVGIVGNSFSVGVAWNSAWFSDRRKGFALGLFGAGNVGASVTKFIGPAIIATTAGSTYFLGIQGGWRLIPVVYAALLTITAIVTWVIAPKNDEIPAASTPIKAQIEPLKEVRVWRFSLYYVVVFGAYVALSSYLPGYYVDNFEVTLARAGLLTATFIFPASLLRPLGGWIADRWGARREMYVTFIALSFAFALLALPINNLAVVVVLVFIVGCAMGFGKAAVYKHIPTYFPDHVGAVGGLVGMLGGLGGFFLPPMFAYAKELSGSAGSTWVILLLFTLVSLIWMHAVIVRMEREKSKSRPIPEA